MKHYISPFILACVWSNVWAVTADTRAIQTELRKEIQKSIKQDFKQSEIASEEQQRSSAQILVEPPTLKEIPPRPYQFGIALQSFQPRGYGKIKGLGTLPYEKFPHDPMLKISASMLMANGDWGKQSSWPWSIWLGPALAYSRHIADVSLPNTKIESLHLNTWLLPLQVIGQAQKGQWILSMTFGWGYMAYVQSSVTELANQSQSDSFYLVNFGMERILAQNLSLGLAYEYRNTGGDLELPQHQIMGVLNLKL